ncbi:unnamed protein product [Bursaphelenchus okinawaensis]|uniref:Selenoprotein K n=1 Tax=Bursaphelenchus okinawaensis TaxID=465554 RepID=A0A811KQP3_9BILA|nr:unnamed protein product [Bursaphelenchus okinawaensis]CAG9109233.1 unnamed protein product [Bursaphelenchus okinawaensis]
MPYVNSEGEVVNNEPALKSVYKFFFELYIGVMLFFRTLFGPLLGTTVSDPDEQDRFRSSMGRRNGGGGGGGGWPGRPGGGGRRPIGRLNNTTTNIPSCASGGCCGG